MIEWPSRINHLQKENDMSAMTPMGVLAHFSLDVNDRTDPASPLVLYFSDGNTSEGRLIAVEPPGSRSTDDFRWMASCLATFHQKTLFDVDGSALIRPGMSPWARQESPQNPDLEHVDGSDNA
jgi:hypothetical protein